MRLDETMLVKQLLPEICHFLHTCREGNQHAAELRNSASGVLFSLSCNNFNAVFSRISTRLVCKSTWDYWSNMNIRSFVFCLHKNKKLMEMRFFCFWDKFCCLSQQLWPPRLRWSSYLSLQRNEFVWAFVEILCINIFDILIA